MVIPKDFLNIFRFLEGVIKTYGNILSKVFCIVSVYVSQITTNILIVVLLSCPYRHISSAHEWKFKRLFTKYM